MAYYIFVIGNQVNISGKRQIEAGDPKSDKTPSVSGLLSRIYIKLQEERLALAITGIHVFIDSLAKQQKLPLVLL